MTHALTPSIQQPGDSAAWLAAATLTTQVFLLALALLLPPIMHGDGPYYLAMTLGLLRHASPALHPDIIASVTDAIGYAPENLAATSNDGVAYPIHFLFYSLVVAPLYALLEALGTNPLRAFQLTNAFALATILFALSRTSTIPAIARAFMGFAVLFSTGLTYLQWPHPEVLSTCLILGAVVCFLTGRFPASAALCALASLQNPSLALFLPLVALEQLRSGHWYLLAPFGSQIKALRELIPTIGCGSLALAPYAWNIWVFGTWSPIASSYVDVSLITWSRLSSIFLDLNQGMLVGLPLLALALPACLLIRAGSMTRQHAREFRREDWLLLAGILVLLPALGQMNWNGGHSVFARYATWASVFPIAWCAMSLSRVRVSVGSAVITPSFALQLAMTVFVAGPSVANHPYYLDFMPWVRPLWEAFPHAYNPTPEIFAERMMRAEGAPRLPVALTDDRGVTLRVLRRQGESWPETSRAVCGRDGRLVTLDGRWSSRPRRHEAEGQLEYVTGRMLCAHSLPIHVDAGSGRNAGLFLSTGWGKPEIGGTWTTDHEATAALRIHGTSSGQRIRLTIRGAAFLAGNLREQRIMLYVNGIRAGEWQANASTREFARSFDVVATSEQTALDLKFVLPDATSPARLGVSADVRRLGLWLANVSVESVPAHSSASE